MAHRPGIVVEGRWYSARDAYLLELGEEALARSTALPVPTKILRQLVKADQLALVDEDEHRGRKPSTAELYARERRRG
jgi:hypothetical protein